MSDAQECSSGCECNAIECKRRNMRATHNFEYLNLNMRESFDMMYENKSLMLSVAPNLGCLSMSTNGGLSFDILCLNKSYQNEK